MKAIICFSTILLFASFTQQDNKLLSLSFGVNNTQNEGHSISFIWQETKKFDFSAMFEGINANLLPVINVYLLNETVPLIER